MKHIKKRFQFQKLATVEEINQLEKVGQYHHYNTVSTLKNPPKNHQCYLLTDQNYLLTAFHVKLNGKPFYIPEPDPILIYFNNAYGNYREIREKKNNLIKLLEDNILSESIINELYHYFGLTNGFIIFLFTAIEAFINKNIPENYTYVVKKRNTTESYDKEQIQRYIGFDDKAKKILKEINGKDFGRNHPMKFQHLTNLKDFRDSIVHTKAGQGGLTPYDYLYKKALNFKYEETLHAARDFMNFYVPAYIEECNCGNDW